MSSTRLDDLLNNAIVITLLSSPVHRKRLSICLESNRYTLEEVALMREKPCPHSVPFPCRIFKNVSSRGHVKPNVLELSPRGPALMHDQK